MFVLRKTSNLYKYKTKQNNLVKLNFQGYWPIDFMPDELKIYILLILENI